MADMGAIQRAAQPAPGGPPPGMGAPPPGGPPEQGGGIETLVETLSAVGEFLKAQGDKPGAQEAMQQLQGLIQSMMQMGGGGGESPAMPSSTGTGKVPENGAGGPQIM